MSTFPRSVGVVSRLAAVVVAVVMTCESAVSPAAGASRVARWTFRERCSPSLRPPTAARVRCGS